MRLKSLFVGFVLAIASLGVAQDTEMEDMSFAIGMLGLKVQQLRQGDLTDRSKDFPKNSYGEVAREMYGIARRTTIRSMETEMRMAQTHIIEVAGLEWAHSPKAALRQIAKATEICSQAKVGHRKEMVATEALFQPSDRDTSGMRDFKAGLRSGLMRSAKEVGGRDYYTLFLILLSKLEDVYRHIDMNRKHLSPAMGPLVFFGDKALDLTMDQRMKAVDKAADDLDKALTQQAKRLSEGMKQVGGLSLPG
jgi:hypothetical protein